MGHTTRLSSSLEWIASGALGLVLLSALMVPDVAHGVTFTGPANIAVGNYPYGLAVGDLNGDSRPDLVTANSSSDDVSILLGNGTGGFSGPTNFVVADTPFSVAVGDFNGDARPDVATANVSPDSVSILLNDGNGGFGGPTNFAVGDGPRSVAVGEFNGDSHLDLATANQASDDVSILLGNGTGGFSGPTSFPVPNEPQWVAVEDFNGDSRTDLAVVGYFSHSVSILLGNGSGQFAAPTSFTVGYPIGIAVGDLNGDSRPDVATGFSFSSGFSDNVAVFLNNGSGGLTGPTLFDTAPTPYSVAVGDLDGDSRLDLTTANQAYDSVWIVFGDGSGSFAGPIRFSVGDLPERVVVADLNGDARLDLVTANPGSHSVSILLNTTGYVRPKATSPARVSLVPAYAQCTSPNRVHGPPDFPGNGSDPDGSCNPPAQSSGHLTAGNPNANFTGTAKLSTVVGVPGGADDADVAIDVKIDDVRCQAGTSTCGPANATGGADYTGEVQVRIDLRITDRYNGSTPAGGSHQGTGDKTFEVTVPCGVSATPNTIGSTCGLTTTADAVYGDPSAVKEAARTVWGLGQVQVYDGGADGNVETPTGNTLFATQGLFVP